MRSAWRSFWRETRKSPCCCFKMSPARQKPPGRVALGLRWAENACMDHLRMASKDAIRAISSEWIEGAAVHPPPYSIYSELVDFRRKRENSVHFGSQECRPKRRCVVFS